MTAINVHILYFIYIYDICTYLKPYFGLGSTILYTKELKLFNIKYYNTPNK